MIMESKKDEPKAKTSLGVVLPRFRLTAHFLTLPMRLSNAPAPLALPVLLVFAPAGVKLTPLSGLEEGGGVQDLS